MTITALALSLCVVLFLLFANFSLVFLYQLFSQGRVHLAYFAASLAVTLVNAGVLWWLWRSWQRGQRQGRLEALRQQRTRVTHERQHARAQVLEALHFHESSTLADMVRLTGLSETVIQDVLDELLQQDQITAILIGDFFHYRMASESAASIKTVEPWRH